MDYENSSPINIDTASHQHISICTQCPQLERKLDESQNELHQLTAKLDTLQKNIDQRNRQVEHLENENRAIQFQVGQEYRCNYT